jgi:hypothetical protein
VCVCVYRGGYINNNVMGDAYKGITLFHDLLLFSETLLPQLRLYQWHPVVSYNELFTSGQVYIELRRIDWPSDRERRIQFSTE